MNHPTKRQRSVRMVPPFAIALLASLTLLLAGVLISACVEVGDDVNSEAKCTDYCDKKFDCYDQEPTDEETDDCIDSCRNDIEDNCGNEHQSDANAKIGECVDMGCADFWACMVFDAAPECFGFVD